MLFLILVLCGMSLSSELAEIVSQRLDKPLRFSYDLEIYWDVREVTTRSSGDVILDQPRRSFRFSGNDTEWVSDGITVWQYSAGTDQVVIQDYLDFDPTLHPSTMLRRFTSYDFEKVRDSAGTSVYQWQAPPDTLVEYQQIDVYADISARRLDTIRLVDRDNNISTYRITSFKEKTDLSEDLFEFTPPRGAHVIDNR